MSLAILVLRLRGSDLTTWPMTRIDPVSVPKGTDDLEDLLLGVRAPGLVCSEDGALRLRWVLEFIEADVALHLEPKEPD